MTHKTQPPNPNQKPPNLTHKLSADNTKDHHMKKLSGTFTHHELEDIMYLAQEALDLLAEKRNCDADGVRIENGEIVGIYGSGLDQWFHSLSFIAFYCLKLPNKILANWLTVG